MLTSITVHTKISTPISKVWECWNNPKHVVNWNFASQDWECTSAENNLEVGGKFTYAMAAKDGSAGFNFEGKYLEINEPSRVSYELGDGRKVSVSFQEVDGQVEVAETFETEDENSVELQQSGWQSILDNFKNYVETET